MSGPARPAAVVLNYRTPDDTRLAIQSIAASRTPLSPIVLVDNESDGSCRAALGALAADVVLLEQPVNLGFPAGVNVGIRAALDRGATHVLLVNSDVILPPDTVGVLLDALAGRPDAGIAGPVLLSRARPGVIASAGMRWTPRTGRMRHPEAGRRFEPAHLADWIEVDGVSGGVMLVRTDVFARVGLFPEEYFFSFEDLAFCLRAREAGLASGVAGRAVAYHEGGRSMGAASVRRLYYGARNQLLLASTASPAGGAAGVLRAASVLALNLAHAVHAPGGTIGSRVAAVVRGARDHARRCYGPDPTG
jgi:GT2 family glycosyltransferase